MTQSAHRHVSNAASLWRQWRSTPLAARGGLCVGTLIAGCAILNAWTFSSVASGPLLQADAWYFLDVFVSKYLEGSLRFWDLFVQRGGSDHAQPLQKLILLFHTRYFDMDFRIEGLLGTGLGIAWCAVLAVAAWMAQQRDGRPPASASAVMALVFVLGLSINSTNVFTWSLVTLIYVTLFAATLYFLAALRIVGSRHVWWMAPLGLLQGLLIDEVAIIVFVASIIAIGLFSPASRHNKIVAAVAALTGLLAARVILYIVSSRGLEPAASSGRSLVDVLFSVDAIRGAMIPLSDGLIHAEHLQRSFPETSGAVMAGLALLVGLLHVYFWVVALASARSGRRSGVLAIAVFLMLTSYALIAGIVVGRVSTFGWSYLHQPRYVLFYQLGLIAIALLFVHRLALSSVAPGTRPFRFEKFAVLTISLALLLVQVAVARASWQLPRHLTPYWQNASLVMQRLADDPTNAASCPDILSVCEYPVEQRERLMGLLAEHQLNIFSPAFQLRNRLYPSAQAVPGLVAAPVEAVTEPADEPGSVEVPQVGISLQAVAGEDGCDDTTGIPLVRIRVDRGMTSGPVQLWSDAPGQSRTLLAERAREALPIDITARLPAAATLSLLAAEDQKVLARASFAPLTCER